MVSLIWDGIRYLLYKTIKKLAAAKPRPAETPGRHEVLIDQRHQVWVGADLRHHRGLLRVRHGALPRSRLAERPEGAQVVGRALAPLHRPLLSVHVDGARRAGPRARGVAGRQLPGRRRGPLAGAPRVVRRVLEGRRRRMAAARVSSGLVSTPRDTGRLVTLDVDAKIRKYQDVITHRRLVQQEALVAVGSGRGPALGIPRRASSGSF